MSSLAYIVEPKMKMVIASPNAHFREHIAAVLEPATWLTHEVTGGAEALGALESGEWQAVLLDRHLEDLDLEELLDLVRSNHSGVELFVKDSDTGQILAPCAVPESPQLRELYEALHQPSFASTREGNDTLHAVGLRTPRNIYTEAVPLPEMVGTSLAMQRTYRMARLVSRRSTTVLLTGESGTGKELVARAIHALSPRSNKTMIAINCAALPEALLETELFGYVKGSFTGALQSRLGRVHAAHGSTLFLDEIGELPLTMQAKLLRFLQEGEVQRLGSNETIRIDTRIIAATNADLAERVASCRFRADLYYRLAVFPIEIEPLRCRPQDIVPLANHFLEAFREDGVAPKTLSEQACQYLEQYAWPGNVRELQQVIERALILAEDDPELFPEHFWWPASAPKLEKS